MKKVTNIYKEIAENLCATMEAMALGMGNIPDSYYEYEDDDDEREGAERYLDVLSSRFAHIAMESARKLRALDPKYENRGILSKMSSEAMRGFASNKDQESISLLVMRAMEMFLSEHRAPDIVGL